MKRQNSLLTLTLCALLIPHFVRAEDDHQVWRDSEDQIVHNTYGNCVRSIWVIDHDSCALPAVAAYTPPPPPQPRTIIAEADRTVFFPFNKGDLTPEARTLLDSLAQRITSASDVQGAQVVGYADRIGTTSYNEVLSQKRAQNVSGYLITHGVVNSSVAETRWVGKSQSNTQCPPGLTHQQLIECLAPDRKVTVELQYKQQVQTQPQTNAAPLPEQDPQDWTGQYSTGQLLQPQQQPATNQNTVAPSVETYPLQQSSVDQNQEPKPQPDSTSPATYTTQASSPAAQYAEQQTYPTAQ